MSSSRPSLFSWKLRLAMAVGALVLGASGARGANPLPGVTIQNVKPVVVMLLDYSGSMSSNCDGAPVGGLIPNVHLRKNPLISAGNPGHFLYDPREWTGDDGSCGGSRGTLWSDSTSGFSITRIEAVKLAVSNILDATGDGVIDASDELVLDVHLGIAKYSGTFTSANYAMQVEASVATPFATAWGTCAPRSSPSSSSACSPGIKDDDVGGTTPTGSALAGVRGMMMEPCWDNNPATTCSLPAADLDVNGNDASLSCRSYFAIVLTDGAPYGSSYNGVDKDPVRVAYRLKNKLTVLGSEFTPIPNEVKTISIGVGADVDDLDSDARGSINCVTYFSGADANYDGDNNPLTMQGGASAPNFQDSENEDHNSSSTTFGIALPNHATGDILVTMVMIADADDVLIMPVGWTAMAGTPITRGTNARYYFHWKRAGASTEPDPAVVRTVVGGASRVVTAAVSFRGARPTGDPWHVVGAADTGTTDPDTLTGLTTSSSNALIVAFILNDDNRRTDGLTSSGLTWTEQYDREDDQENPDYGLHVWTGLKSTPGATGDASINFSGNPGGWGGFMAALVSGASGGGSLVGSACDTSDSGSGGFDDDSYGGSSCVGPDFVCGLGNGYFAQDSAAIQDAVEDAFSFATTGSFSGSQPTVSFNIGGLSVGNVVYATFFDVVPNQFLWRGHLRKYRYNAALAAPDYVDCDNPAVAVSFPEACWDAGGLTAYQVVNTAGFTVADETSTSHYGLAERHWSTRRIFAANPLNLLYNDNTTAEYSTRPAVDVPVTVATRSVKSLVGSLVTGSGVPYPPAAGDILVDPLYLTPFIAMSTMKTATNTYLLADITMTNAEKEEALKAFMFAAGRPTSRYADDITQRCPIAPSCTDSVPTMKLMDSFHSRPVLVGPPSGVSTDPTYIGTFFEQVLTPTSYSSPPYLEDVVEDDNVYVTTSSGSPGSTTIANPCGEGFSGTCRVKARRKVIYTGGNDGMMHAFDELTGHELWAFIPPSNMRRLKEMRSDRAVYVDGAFTVRDVKFPTDVSVNYADGLWHTVLISSQGLGGNFYFAMDVTNPVDPVFLWEYRKPDKLGNTVPRAVIGEVIGPTPTTDSNPGSVVFASGGTLPSADDAFDNPKHSHFFTLRVHTGLRLKDKHTSPTDLPSASTSPAAVVNAMLGEPRPVDADLDGRIDRVYFGDAEGRMWKACNLKADGDFTLEMFFDPATYDDPESDGPGQPIAGNNNDPTDNRMTLSRTAADRKTLRGPIYFPADVTHDGNGKLLVAFGSGNVFDPLSAPAGYNNFLWVVADNENGGSGSCGAATASTCTGSSADMLFTGPVNSSAFDNVLPVNKLLTGPPLILNKYLIYPEFERFNAVSSCTAAAYESRVIARDALTCGTPAAPPFRDALNNPTNVITYTNTLVTGIQVDPRSGTLFAQTSAGAGPPSAINSGELQAQMNVLGWKLSN